MANRVVTAQELLQLVASLFKDTGIHVCTEGTCYLGAAIGKARFLQSFVQDKVDAWVCEIKTLSKISLDQPQAAYAAFTHGVRS